MVLRKSGTIFCAHLSGHRIGQPAGCMIGGLALMTLLLGGCVAQQADLKQTEKTLQQRIKQSNDDLAQTRARQSQEISSLRESELPQLRGDLEKATHQAQDLQAKQEDLKHRSAQLEQQTKKLEQLVAKIEADSTTRYAWVQKSLDNQDAKVAARLEEISKAMDASMAALKRDVVEAVQRTNEGLGKRVDAKLDEQQKGQFDSQHRLDQVSQKFTQFNQALTGYKEALSGLNDRLSQEEQTSKTLLARIDADTKAATIHANEVNRSVASVAKALEAVGQKVTARFDEQDHRIDALAKSVDQVQHKMVQHSPQPSKQVRVAPAPVQAQEQTRADASDGESMPPPQREQHEAGTAMAASIIAAPQESTAQIEPAHSSDPADRVRYERVLALFRDGDLDGARQGFASFLSDYPNSDLAPNARYWLGESYFGKKDFRKAIDAYDKVELDYPGSEKVPAAILKKGYAYLALKDKKRASSAFKQVVTLYPRTPEAGKASDKLAQLKEVR
jgi:tol-pal system protein YbgF